MYIEAPQTPSQAQSASAHSYFDISGVRENIMKNPLSYTFFLYLPLP